MQQLPDSPSIVLASGSTAVGAATPDALSTVLATADPATLAPILAPVLASVIPVATAAATAATAAAVLASALPVVAATAALATSVAMGPCVEHLLRPRLYDGALGHSVFTVASFASPEECDALMSSADRLLQSYGERVPQPVLCRLSIVSKVEALLLRRLLALLEERLPLLAESLFGRKQQLAEMAVQYSPGEPAVNVYLSGGHFAPHTDKQALTLLVPLSPAGAFEGGGTAFWRDGHHAQPPHAGQTAHEQGDERGWLPHDLVLRPPRGTAIIFGGNVTHAGLAVTSGTRHLFVLSFTLRPAAAPSAAPATQTLKEEAQDREDSAEELAALADFAELFGAGAVTAAS